MCCSCTTHGPKLNAIYFPDCFTLSSTFYPNFFRLKTMDLVNINEKLSAQSYIFYKNILLDKVYLHINIMKRYKIFIALNPKRYRDTDRYRNVPFQQRKQYASRYEIDNFASKISNQSRGASSNENNTITLLFNRSSTQTIDFLQCYTAMEDSHYRRS